MKKSLCVAVLLSFGFIQSAEALCCPGANGCRHDIICIRKCGDGYECNFERSFMRRKSDSKEIFCVKELEDNAAEPNAENRRYVVAGRQYICMEEVPYQFDESEEPETQSKTPTNCPFCEQLRELKEKY